jgi:hypothetical protein
MFYHDERAHALNYLINNSTPMGSGRDDDCREWQGSLTKQGYGQIGIKWIVEQFGIKGAHRLMAHLVSGHDFVSRSEQVLHECHNRRCLNPAHLRIGTALENMAEMREAGREPPVRRKVSDNDIRAIRARRAAGERTSVLAREFGISPNHCSKIIGRRIWADVA